MQAIGQVARCTIRLVSYAAASHPALDNFTRMPWFMVRVRFRAKLAASIERTATGLALPVAQGYGSPCRAKPAAAAHVER